MARGLLAGLFFGVLLAGFILAVAALQLNPARHIDVVEVPPDVLPDVLAEVLAGAGQAPMGDAGVPALPRLPAGDADVMRPPEAQLGVESDVDVPQPPLPVLQQPEGVADDLSVLSGPDSVSPEVDPFGPEGVQSPLAVVSEVLGLTEAPGPLDTPILERVLPSLLPDGERFDDLPALGDVTETGEAPAVALAEPAGARLPEIVAAVPDVSEARQPEIDVALAALADETERQALQLERPVVGPVPQVRDLLDSVGQISDASQPVIQDGPVMALVLRGAGGPAGDMPDGVKSRLVALGAQGAVVADVEQVVLVPEDVARGALSLLAWELGQQAYVGPLWLRHPPTRAEALDDVLGLAAASGVGLIVEQDALALRGALVAHGIAHAPAIATNDLARAAAHARRDGAVIVVLEAGDATEAAVARWAASEAGAGVRLVSVSEALARLAR